MLQKHLLQMLQKCNSSGMTLAVLLTIAAPIPAVVLSLNAGLASAVGFSLPETVANGTKVRIDGDSSMATLNQALKQKFETQFAGTNITLAEQGSTAALKALQDGQIDIAAIGRVLTPEEKANGLMAVPISRPKIAVIIGPDNPFKGSLTNEQFAKIFRGEITDWSQVGGPPGPIRLVDRPETSDTRQAFSYYSVFESAPFQAGSTAVGADNHTDAVISKLGKDGIGYAIAPQVLNRSDVKIVPLHNVLPADQRYSFSQGLSYVYKGPNPNPAAQSFLGYATAPMSQATIAETSGIATGALGTVSGAVAGTSNPTANSTGQTNPTRPSESAVTEKATEKTDPVNSATSVNPTDTTEKQVPILPPPETSSTTGKFSPWWWLLLPLLGIPLLAWLFGRRGREADRTPDHAHLEATLPPVTTPLAAAGVAAAGAAAVGAGAMIAHPASTRMILVPRNCRQAYAYWELSDAQQRAIKQEGGESLKLRLYDRTEQSLTHSQHRFEQFDCDERECDYLMPIAHDDRDYVAELGYLTRDNRWLKLATSEPVRVPACAVQPTVAPTVNRPENRTEVQKAVAPDTERTVVPEKPTVQPTPTMQPPDRDRTPGLGTVIAAGAAGAAAVGATVGAAAMTRSPEAKPVSHADAIAPIEPSRVILVSQDDHHAYAYWEIPDIHHHRIREQGGRKFALRIGDANGLSDTVSTPHSYRQYDLLNADQDCQVVLPAVNRDYVAEVGYETADRTWLPMARSQPIRPLMGKSTPSDEMTTTRPPIAPAPTVPTSHLTSAAVYRPGAADQTWIALTPLNSHQADVNWHISNDHRQLIQEQGGRQMVLKIHDADQVDLDRQAPHSTQEYPCSSDTEHRLVELPESDRDYVAEIGYLTRDDRWLRVARSVHSHSPTPEYDGCRIVIIPSDSHRMIDPGPTRHPKPQAYVYWDIAPDRKQALRRQGGNMLVLRVYDADHIDLDQQRAHHTDEYMVDENARDKVVVVPVGDRDYVAEIGYLTLEGRFLSLGRSLHSHIPSLRKVSS